MNVPDPVQEATAKWLLYARADLDEARLNLTHGGAPFIACFHAQQAAEKAIKACYVWLQSPFLQIHDLDRLRNLLPGQWNFKTDFDDLVELSSGAVATRYPGVGISATTLEAQELFAAAESLLDAIIAELISKGYED